MCALYTACVILVKCVIALVLFFFIGRAQSDPIWSVYLPAEREKEWPDRVWPVKRNGPITAWLLFWCCCYCIVLL